MQTHIAQTIAIACHANAALRDGLARPLEGNSTFQFCEWVRLASPRRGLAALGAGVLEPQAWIAALVAGRAARVRIDAQDGWRLDAQDGWRLTAVLADGSRVGWRSRWDLGDRERPDRRIWRVTYAKAPPAGREAADVDLARAAAALEQALGQIAQFARRHAQGAFLSAFEPALTALRTGEPRGYHQDLAPPGALPPTARRLLDTCQVGWVFGGMGSWNDTSYEGAAGREYDRVTSDYYDALCAGLVAATNASAG